MFRLFCFFIVETNKVSCFYIFTEEVILDNYKYLIKNISILTIANFSTKFVSFFLLPLYTSYLTTTEYGIFDIYCLAITLIFPISSVCVSESVVRFLITSDNRQEIINISLKYYIYSVIIFLFFQLTNKYYCFLPELNKYPIIHFILFISISFNSLIFGYCRGEEKIKEMSLAAFISTLITIILNIIFLVNWNMGLIGYFYSTIIGLNIANVYCMFKLSSLPKLTFKKINRSLEKEILLYGKGLVINSVSWWINLGLNKYFVLYLCNISESGILSAAYKIPTILSSFQSVFEQAWLLSAVKNYDKNDKTKFFIRTYNFYNLFCVFLSSIIIILTKILSSFLYQNSFYMAWKIVPLLMLSILFSCAAGFIGCIFAAQKNTKLLSNTTLVGAFLNIILGIIFINYYGIVGAGIASLLTHFAIYLLRLIYIKKSMTFRINVIRDALVYLILVIQIMCVYINESIVTYLIQIILFVTTIALFTCEIKNIGRRIL